MPDPRVALERWLAALSSENCNERSDAAELPPDDATDDEIVAALLPLLDDPVEVVRLCAAETLGHFPAPRSVAALRAFIAREADPLAKAHGLSSLGLIGTSQDLAVLLPETSEDRPAHVRIHALVGLHELVRRGVKHGLVALLEHEAAEVRVAAAEGLATVLERREDGDAAQALARCAAREPSEARRDDIIAALRRVQGSDEDPA